MADKKDLHQVDHLETTIPIQPANSHNEREEELKDAPQLEGMTMEDRAVALKLAQAADPGPAAFSPAMIKFTLYTLVICMCSGDSGFDGTVMSSVNSMARFLSFMGLPAGGAPKTGVVFGAYTIGQVLAFFLAAWLPDKLGRRYGMFIGNSVLILGALLSTFAVSQTMFIIGRVITGLGCTTAATSAKSYLAEITSPATRGRWMGLLNSFYYVGQLLASGVCIPLGLQTMTDWSWRGPILLQALPALINCSFVLFLPESPRWLYSRGHKDRAVEILANLHSRTKDVQSPLIQLEIEEIIVNISVDGSDKHWWDFRQLFVDFGSRYRFGLCFLVSVYGQLSGNGLITYFLPVLLLNAGITDSNRQRVLNFVNSVTSMIGALTGTSLSDKVGRRFLLLFASTSCCIGMFLVAGLLSPAGTVDGKFPEIRSNAGISFIFLFMVFYSFGWTPMQACYPAEVLSFQNRAKGLALQSLCTSAVSLINTFGLPVALPAIGWKTYLIFGCWDILGVLIIYFFAPETKQLSLEDIDEVFASRNPKQKSLEFRKTAKRRAREEREQLAHA